MDYQIVLAAGYDKPTKVKHKATLEDAVNVGVEWVRKDFRHHVFGIFDVSGVCAYSADAADGEWVEVVYCDGRVDKSNKRELRRL